MKGAWCREINGFMGFKERVTCMGGYERQYGNGYEDIERKGGGDRLSMIGRRCERNGSMWVCE